MGSNIVLRKIYTKLTEKRKKHSRDGSSPRKYWSYILCDWFHIMYILQVGKHGNQAYNFLLTKEIQKHFCMCHLNLSNCHMCNNCMSKKLVVKNKMCFFCTCKLNLACVGVLACDCMPFMVRPELYHTFIFIFISLFFLVWKGRGGDEGQSARIVKVCLLTSNSTFL